MTPLSTPMRPTAPRLAAWLAAVLLLVTGGALGAQGTGMRTDRSSTPDRPVTETTPLKVFAYQLRHRPLLEAATQIQPMLSSRGSLELRPADNTLVIRDSVTALTRIVPALHQLDHATRDLMIEVTIVEAHRAVVSPILPSDELPEAFAQRLKEVLPYRSFRVMAYTRLTAQEGQEVTYQVDGGFELDFRLGTVVGDRQLKLHGFRVSKLAGSDPAKSKQLYHSNLNLLMTMPTVLVLASDESSRTAFAVILTPRVAEPAAARR